MKTKLFCITMFIFLLSNSCEKLFQKEYIYTGSVIDKNKKSPLEGIKVKLVGVHFLLFGNPYYANLVFNCINKLY